MGRLGELFPRVAAPIETLLNQDWLLLSGALPPIKV
jgi:hypothetical protein